jgi:hypothetical protein
METVMILNETNLQIVENNIGVFSRKLQLITGASYVVTWNGKEYLCVCKEIDDDGVLYSALGNVSELTGGENTGEPFFIVVYPLAIALQANYGAEVHILDGSSSVTLSIMQRSAAVIFDETEVSSPVPYAYCGAHCKYPVYTREQITSILQQLVNGNSFAAINPALSPVVRLIQERHNNKQLSLWLGTEAEFNALHPQPAASLVMMRTDKNGQMYLCTDDSTLSDWYNNITKSAADSAENRVTPLINSMTKKVDEAVANFAENSGDVTANTPIHFHVSASGVSITY